MDGRMDRRTHTRTDGRTDTQKFGGYNIIPCHFLWRGIKSRNTTKIYVNTDGITVDTDYDAGKYRRNSKYWDMYV